MRQSASASLIAAAAFALAAIALVPQVAFTAEKEIEGCVQEKKTDALVLASYGEQFVVRLGAVSRDPHSTSPGQCKVFTGELVNQRSTDFPWVGTVMVASDIGDPEERNNAEIDKQDDDDDDEDDED